MDPAIHSITFDCTGDPYDLGVFWSELLGRPLADDDKPGDPEALIQDPDGGPRLLFVRVPEGKTAKNRIHLDLRPTGRTRAAEVERALALGARLIADRTRPDGGGWFLLADPEGNEFCVERGESDPAREPGIEAVEGTGATNPVRPADTRESTLRLEKVTPDNVEAAVALKVRPDQERFVSTVVKSLAEAYAQPRPGTAWPRLVYDGDELVGFVMAFFDVRFEPDNPEDRPRSGLWRLNIAEGRQGRGYGTFAVRAVCEEVRRRGRSRFVTVTWEEGADGPEPFYLRLGFRPTGETSGGQVVADLDLDA